LTPRVVVDPGVMVSALLVSISPPAQVLDGWRERRFKMVVSDRLLDELEEVLFRPKFRQRVTTEQRTSFLALLRQRGESQPDPPAAPGLTADPGDDYLAALALAVRATHLVTGDKGLLGWQNDAVIVTTPRRFIEDLTRVEAQAERPS